MTEPKSIVLLGTGRVATHLALALSAQRTYQLVQIYGRSKEGLERLAERLAATVCSTTTLAGVMPNADYYIFAISDNALGEVFSQMPTTQGIWLHTAGSIPLNSISQYHPEAGVLYPLQTFSLEKAVDWQQVPIYIEATTERSAAKIESLALALSPIVYHATSHQREALHLGAVVACNFSNHLIALAQEWLEMNALPENSLLPLLREMLDKLHYLPAHAAQTGPAVRGDNTTLQRHEELLERLPQLQSLYHMLSESIIQKHRSDRATRLKNNHKYE